MGIRFWQGDEYSSLIVLSYEPDCRFYRAKIAQRNLASFIAGFAYFVMPKCRPASDQRTAKERCAQLTCLASMPIYPVWESHSVHVFQKPWSVN